MLAYLSLMLYRSEASGWLPVEFIHDAGALAPHPAQGLIPPTSFDRLEDSRMAFDKAKVVRAAEKSLAQGKIPSAIKEYRQIVENDPEDFTALNMLGDLYVRQNDKQQAMQCFLRIAEHYREEGFESKAIAMYKKIDRLNPRSPEIANKLAALYESQGLVVDARAQYMIIAEAWLRDGQSRKALEILRKVADLEPQNTETRIKLAQSYMREGMEDEAAEAFAEAGAHLLSRAAYERAAEAYTSSLDIRPRNYAALSGYLSSQIALGTPEEAAEVLERALAEMPQDIELLSMLAQAHIEAEDAPAAERAVTSLVTADAAHFLRFVDVARLYLKAGQVDEAVLQHHGTDALRPRRRDAARTAQRNTGARPRKRRGPAFAGARLCLAA
jgi:Flp pilus assembly protein TadD